MARQKTWMVAASLLALTACDPESDGIEGVGEPTGFAVTHSDYESAGAIALLDPDGELVKARFIHSGTVFAGLGSALSSDVVLPNTAGAGSTGVLTYIERLGTDTVTRIDIEAGEVLGQVLTDGSATDAYRPNPYDFLQVSEGQGWVTRNAPNTEASSTSDNAGTDLVALDLTTNALTTDRIGLSAMNAVATVTNFDTGETSDVVVYARPARMVQVGSRVVVGLERISLAYDAIGPGMVAIANLEAKTAVSLELDGFSNCGSVTPVLDDASRVIVSCVGSFLAVERDEAGHVLIHINEAGVATIEHTWAAADHADDALATSGAVSLGGTRVVAIATGASWTTPPTTDEAYVLDIATGEMEKFADADGAYVLGSGAYNPVARVLLLPDASADADGVVTAGLRRFQWNTEGAVTELSIVETDSDIPPRAVSALQ